MKGMSMTKVVILLMVCLVATGVIAAEESVGGMKTTLAAGVNVQSGNSDTMTANASLLTEGEKAGLGSVRAGVEANYGESTIEVTGTDGMMSDIDETTVKNAKIFANAKKTLTEKTFGYGDLGVFYDEIAKIDQRTTVGVGGGVYLVKDETTKLSAELGISQVFEDVADMTDDYLAVRMAERFDHELSKTAKVWESVEYLPEAADFGNFLLNAEIGIEAAVNSHVSLRFVVQEKYDSEPAAGLEKGELSVIAGFSSTL